MTNRLLAALAALLTLLALGAGALLAANALHGELLEQRHERVREQVEGVARGVRRALDTRLQALRETAALVNRGWPVPAGEFMPLARDLHATVSGLRELRISYDEAIVLAYPPSALEAPPGASILPPKPLRESARRALDARAPLVTGPRPLSRGGSGLVAHLPVAAGAETVWLSASIDLEALLADAGIFDQYPDIELALRGSDARGRDGDIFFGHEGVFYSEAVYEDIALPVGSWQLAALPREGWGRADAIAGRLRWAGGGLALLAALAVFVLLGYRDAPAWLSPALFAGLLLAGFSALIWIAQIRQHEIDRQALIRDSQQLQFSLRSLLQANLDYLRLLARARINDDLTPQSLARRTLNYLAGQEELAAIDWVQPERPGESGPLLGADPAFPGRERATVAAARLAFDTRRPAYSDAFSALDGSRHFDLWVPLYRGPEFLGWLRAHYRFQPLLETVLVQRLREHYAATVVNANGHTLAVARDRTGALDPSLRHQVALDPPGHGTALRLSGYSTSALDPLTLALGLLSIALATGMFWTHWRLRQSKTLLEQTVTRRTRSLEQANSELLLEVGERRRAEKELQSSRERYRRLVEGLSTSFIFAQDSDGTLSYVSPGAVQILGFPQTELLIGFTRLFSHHPDNQRAVNANQAALRGSAQARFEARCRHQDGREVVLEISQRPVFDDSGNVLAVEGIATDITERKHAELELAQYRDRLQDLVAMRTASLELLNRELEAFSYSVSHDLRAPLRAIDGFSKALAEDCAESLNDLAREHLSRIRAASQRMGALIDALLQLSRLTRQKMNLQQVDISTLVHEVFEVFRDQAPQRGASLLVQDGVAAVGDPELLRAALANLIGNAWKYSAQEAHAQIEFGTLRRDGETVYYVSDNGVGFEADRANEVFGSFKRLHSDSEFDGSGIGLSTVARIVRRHNGRVWAESTPGEGAIFYFTLNAGDAGAGVPTPTEVPAGTRETAC